MGLFNEASMSSKLEPAKLALSPNPNVVKCVATLWGFTVGELSIYELDRGSTPKKLDANLKDAMGLVQITSQKI